MVILTCPECGFVSKAPQGLGRHRWAKHGVAGTSRNTLRLHRKNALAQAAPKPVERPALYREGPLDRGEREALRRRLLYTINAFAGEVKRYPRSVLASMREIVASGFMPDRSLLTAAVDPEDSFGTESAC